MNKVNPSLFIYWLKKHFKLLLIIIFPLFFWSFFLGILSIYKIYSSFWLWENTLAAAIIIFLYIFTIFKSRLKKDIPDNENFSAYLVLTGLFLTCTAHIINLLFFQIEIFTPIFTITTFYFITAFYLRPKFWKFSSIFYFLLILTLPVMERLQRFVGFPLRLFTANIVSYLLKIMGISSISNSAIIMTENYATNIDLPCSGVKSLYFGLIILIIIFFLQKVKINFKAFLLSIVFFLLLIIFNIWRVFILVYTYGVLHQIEIGDQIHLILGISGFIISCLFLWFGAKYLCQENNNQVKIKNKFQLPQINLFKSISFQKSYILALEFILFTGIIANLLKPQFITPNNDHYEQFTQKFSFGVNQKSIELSNSEQTLFSDSDIFLAIKNKFNWQSTEYELLLVGSQTAKAHHDPETCLQAQGYHLIDSQIINITNASESANLKKLSIQTDSGIRGIVYYWFISENKIITDYTEKIWEQVKSEDHRYIMIELMVEENNGPEQSKLEELFGELNGEVRGQLLRDSMDTKANY